MLVMAAIAAIVVCNTNPASAELVFNWVTVGDPGNVADSFGTGSVADEYRIARYEVTNNQYTAFLNAIAATDTNNVYATNMGSDARGGIIRSGSTGSFSYTLKPNMGNKPVNFVTYFNAMRFVNWLHNGQPSGMQDASTTENGVYAINDGISETRAVDAQYFLPTRDEWHKAAYYDPRNEADGGPIGDDHHWLLPTMSEFTLSIVTAAASGNGDISNPGGNVVNILNGADWNALDGNVTTVGSAGTLSRSYYGTLDQGGNVREWNESLINDNHYILGGSYKGFEADLFSVTTLAHAPSLIMPDNGFRIASPLPPEGIPTVSQWGLAVMLLLLLTAGTIIMKRRVPQAA